MWGIESQQLWSSSLWKDGITCVEWTILLIVRQEAFFQLSFYNTLSGGMDQTGSSSHLLTGRPSRLPHWIFSWREREISLYVETSQASIIPFDHYSSFTRLKHVTAWILHFVENCRKRNAQIQPVSSLLVEELHKAERYWLRLIQHSNFED